jgi:hypothetical protein
VLDCPKAPSVQCDQLITWHNPWVGTPCRSHNPLWSTYKSNNQCTHTSSTWVVSMRQTTSLSAAVDHAPAGDQVEELEQLTQSQFQRVLKLTQSQFQRVLIHQLEAVASFRFSTFVQLRITQAGDGSNPFCLVCLTLTITM